MALLHRLPFTFLFLSLFLSSSSAPISSSSSPPPTTLNLESIRSTEKLLLETVHNLDQHKTRLLNKLGSQISTSSFSQLDSLLNKLHSSDRIKIESLLLSQNSESNKKLLSEVSLEDIENLSVQNDFLINALLQEQTRLIQLEHSLDNSQLIISVRQHLESLLKDMDSGETLAALSKLSEYIALVESMEGALQDSLQRAVDVIPKTHSFSLAFGFILYLILASPLAIFAYVMVKFSRKVTLPQVILLTHSCFFLISLAFVILGLHLRQEPMNKLAQTHREVLIALQIGLSMIYVTMMGLLARAIITQRELRSARVVYVVQFVLYLIIGLHYRVKAWRPVLLQRVITLKSWHYVMYLLFFLCMVSYTTNLLRRSLHIAIDRSMGYTQHDSDDENDSNIHEINNISESLVSNRGCHQK